MAKRFSCIDNNSYCFNDYGTADTSSSTQDFMPPEMAEQQAEVFLVDAEEYRSIHHRIDLKGLKVYKFLYSTIWMITLYVSIIALLCLAFLEFPSSLSQTSFFNVTVPELPRYQVALSVLHALESIFLIVILVDALLQIFVFGPAISKKNPWLVTLLVLMFISWIDLFVSMGLGHAYFFRIRRFFRPFFAMQKSQLMKKVLKSLSKTVPDIFSAFVLLALWLLAFTLMAVSIFSGFETQDADNQFHSFYDGLFTLLVLLTTANNPDAMVRVFNENRLAFIFFVLFMAVGIFVFMNVLIAIVFNEFRGHVLESMQASLVRRRVASRALYEVLRESQDNPEAAYHDEVDVSRLIRVITNSSIAFWRKREMIKVIESLGRETADWQHVKSILGPLDDHKESKMVFDVPKYNKRVVQKIQKFLLSKSFEIIGLLVCLANIIVIAIDVSTKFTNESPYAKSLNTFNWIFIILYVTEQVAKYFAMGRRTYFSKQGCIIDFIITLIILIMKITETSLLLTRKKTDFIIGKISVWDLSRLTNLLILARAARIVLFFPSLTPIINTLFDIPWRMKSVIGLMLLHFYLYALLGMNIFEGKINQEFLNRTHACGTYQELNYSGFNFNDFYSSLVVLFCLLIVNNWHIFMKAFEQATGTGWVHIYMISFWISAVIVMLNCVTAFVIEAYIQRKSFYEERRIEQNQPRTVTDTVEETLQYLRSTVIVNNSFTFQMLFQKDLKEPTDEELMSTMKTCQFLCLLYPHIIHSHYES